MIIEGFGWLGGLLFAISAIPQAYLSYKNGHSKGISAAFLWMWFLGEVCVIIYTIPKLLWPLLINYCFNFVMVLIILWYKYNPR